MIQWEEGIRQLLLQPEATGAPVAEILSRS